MFTKCGFILLGVRAFELYYFVINRRCSSNRVQRAAADQILRDLQANPDMWLQVVHILQNTKSMDTKFFALQVSFYHSCMLSFSLIVTCSSADTSLA